MPKTNKQIEMNIETVLESINKLDWIQKEFKPRNRSNSTKNKKKSSTNVSFDKG